MNVLRFIDGLLTRSKIKVRLPARRYWAEYTCQTGRLLIKAAFLCGALPLLYKIHDHRIQHATSRLHRFRCNVCLGLTLSALLAILAFFLRDLLNGEIIFMELESMFRVFILISSFGAALFHLHTCWKIKSMVAFVNGCDMYYDQFKGN